jgi:hypothetical protein
MSTRLIEWITLWLDSAPMSVLAGRFAAGSPECWPGPAERLPASFGDVPGAVCAP